jgi:hypothetical protein
MTRLPNYITFAWERSDGDYEVVGTLNGETIDSDTQWNHLVEQMLAAIRAAREDFDTLDIRAYAREDVYSVLEAGEDDDWMPIDVGGAA